MTAAQPLPRVQHQFETFRRELVRQRAEPLITIQRRGAISLNASAYAALGAPAGIELLYDPDKRRIGLRAVDPRQPHSHLVRSSTRSPAGPFVVSASAFLNFYDVDTSVALRWPAHLEDGVLCIDLRTDGMPAIARGRATNAR